MQNVESEQFSFDVLKAAYDSDPTIQELIKNFDQNKIELNTGNASKDFEPKKRAPKNTVKNMAKSAVDLKGL